MNRLFGKGKTKEPPPNLGDCVSNVRILLITKIDNTFTEIELNIRMFSGDNINVLNSSFQFL